MSGAGGGIPKFVNLKGTAAPLDIQNIDTDMIIPKEYLKTIKRTGLGVNLFNDIRYNKDGSENPDFVLNKPAYRKAEVLVAGDNFGCGSSREHAPWALKDFGILAAVGIFASFVLMLTFVPALRLVLDRRAEAAGTLPVESFRASSGERGNGVPLPSNSLQP